MWLFPGGHGGWNPRPGASASVDLGGSGVTVARRQKKTCFLGQRWGVVWSEKWVFSAVSLSFLASLGFFLGSFSELFVSFWRHESSWSWWKTSNIARQHWTTGLGRIMGTWLGFWAMNQDKRRAENISHGSMGSLRVYICLRKTFKGSEQKTYAKCVCRWCIEDIIGDCMQKLRSLKA